MTKRILSSVTAMVFFIAFGQGITLAQTITVEFADLAGSPGDTVYVPVDISGVESTSGFSSFQFEVTVSNSNLSLPQVRDDDPGTGTDETEFFHRSDGHLSDASGWTVRSNRGNGTVGAFASSQDAITSSGRLLELAFRVNGTEGGAIIELTELKFNLGSEVINHSPETPAAGLNISNRPEAVDDSYGVDEGGTLNIDASNGVLANDTDADGDPLTASLDIGVSNGTLSLDSDGSFVYQHDGSETTADFFTYTVSDGSTTADGTVQITINPVNDLPVFVDTEDDITVNEGDLVTGSFMATDGDGDVLTYSISQGPASATIDSNGTFRWQTEDGDAGSHVVSISVSDGTESVDAGPFTITVRAVDNYSSTLSGFHQVSPLSLTGSGSMAASYVPEDAMLFVSGSFEALSSSYASAQLQVGTIAEEGTAVITLTPQLDNSGGTGRAGSFSEANNTFDLDTVSFPSGMTKESFVSALEAGEVFVNVRSIDFLDGELRGHLRTDTNQAPSAVDATAPGAVTITGDPGDVLYDVSFGTATDADGDDHKSILVASGDPAFASILTALDVTFTTGSGVSVHVSDAAELYDEISGGTPGNINVGGTVPVYYRIVTTDGSAITTGAVAAVDLTRGMVTDAESEDSLPDQFLLRGNYPNPFNPVTTVQFDLPETAEVQVSVLDLLGRTMLQVPGRTMSAGANQSVRLDASDLGSGIYLYRVIARGAGETHVATGTMTLIK